MPKEVDVATRLRQIAEATLEVAQSQGVGTVSYRSVAKALGGSTTVVTNYLPTRGSLLENALRHVNQSWEAEMDEALAAAAPGEALLTLARWSCTTQPADLIVRRMLIRALAEMSETVEMLPAFQDDALMHRRALERAARLDGYAEPEQVADAVYLMCRGFYLATVEAREGWPDERARAAVDAVMARLRPL